MTLPLDPDGLHYRHIVPDEWGPFTDCRATLNALAVRMPWVSVITPAVFDSDPHLAESTVCYVDWSNRCAPLTGRAAPGERKATVLLYSLEGWDPAATMLPSHVAHWQAFEAAAPSYDGVLTYTPELSEALTDLLGRKCWLYPLGYDPLVKGLPRFEAPKFREYLWWGSLTGKRLRTVPFVQATECLTGRVHDVSGLYGRALTGALDNASAALHLAHSDMYTFPQWRAWQVIGTSAALVAESPRPLSAPDMWPLVPDRHVLTFPPVCEENLEQMAALLASYLGRNLEEIARCAYEEIGLTYTALRCHERYLIPACHAARERAGAST